MQECSLYSLKNTMLTLAFRKLLLVYDVDHVTPNNKYLFVEKNSNVEEIEINNIVHNSPEYATL